MKKNLQAVTLKRKMLLAAVTLGAFCTTPALAQLNYRPTSSTNVVTTYTDLGTTGSAIATANNDDANSAATPIGFTFSYNGQTFTDFILNTNGFIKLGTTAPASAAVASATTIFDITDQNIIAPAAGVDLTGAANQTANPTEFRVATTGTAPNRVTTIQWENLEDKATPASSANAQFTAIQFQVKLYETTNVIEFVYGTWTTNGAVPTSGQPFIIALKGSSSAFIDRLLVTKPSSGTPWTGTNIVFTTGTTAAPARHFIRNTFGPDAGRTYRFTPVVIPPNDLTVDDIFTQGKISVAGGAPHAVKAIIKNVGTATATNKTITLTISGVNASTLTTTVASLAPGATTEVTFPTYTPTTVGQNFLEVTVPSDDNNTNNVLDKTQFVTADQETYAFSTSPTTDPVPQTVNAGPFGNTEATNSGARLSKFTTVNKIRINSVRTYIAHNNGPTQVFNTIGRTVKAIVVDAAGNVIGQSAPITLTANDVDKFIDIPLTTPAVVENANYFVGLDLAVSSTATTYALAFTSQNQIVARTGATYVMPSPGATLVAPTASATQMLLLFEAQVTNITGLKEDLNSALVSVFPNPSNGVLNISAKDLKGGNTLALEVRDMQGRVVYTGSAAKNGATLNLNKLASGVYLLKVSTDADVAMKRLVIQ